MSSKRALRAGALCLAALCLALLATGSAAPAADAGRSASGSELRPVAMPEGPGALHRAYIDAGGEFRPDELLTRGELAQFICRAYGPLELGEFFPTRRRAANTAARSPRWARWASCARTPRAMCARTSRWPCARPWPSSPR